tara:strand:- start:1225 stop:1764 length:540 start_codon:yes stop_codon:yes gene_type:complete
MGLHQVDKVDVTSAVSDIQLTGINTDDVYMLIGTGVHVVTNGGFIQTRVVKDVGGTPTTLSDDDYKIAAMSLRANSTFYDYANNGVNRTEIYWQGAQPHSNDVNGEGAACIMYLHNFNSSSEYSSIIINDMAIESTSTSINGNVGGVQFAVNEAHIGISISGYSTNIDGGKFTLYRIGE